MPPLNIPPEEGKLPVSPPLSKGSPQDYVRRRAEVDRQDYAEFQAYLAEKRAVEARKAKSAPTKRRVWVGKSGRLRIPTALSWTLSPPNA